MMRKTLKRPTEITTAVLMLFAAVGAFKTDHDLAALVAVVAACLPAVTTYAVEVYREARADELDES